MSMNVKQLRNDVIEPVLSGAITKYIPYSEEAVHLLLMTAAHESLMGTYLRQVRGPALGIYQMEPATYDDIWKNYLSHRSELSMAIWGYSEGSRYQQLIWDLRYATVMARVHYYRVPLALPKMDSFSNKNDYVKALATYAKHYYNTELGKATVKDYENAFMYFCKDELDKDWNE